MELLVNFTITTSLTAIGIIIVKKLFKNKLPVKLHYYIWIILVLRIMLTLLEPFITYESSLSIYNVVPMVRSNYSQNESANSLPDDVFIQANEKYPKDAEVVESLFIKDGQHSIKIRKSVADFINLIWIFGGSFLAIYFILIYLIRVRRINKLPDCCMDIKQADLISQFTYQELQNLLCDCKKKIGVKRNVVLKLHTKAPMLIGVIKPVVLLSHNYSKHETEKILLHELFHLKQHDNIKSFLCMILLCINWYNPILWYCYVVYKEDTEVLCDANVISITGDKKEYAKLLLKTALNKTNLVPIATFLQGRKKELKHRIQYLSTFKRPSIVWSILFFLIVGTFMVTNLTSAKQQAASRSSYVKLNQNPLESVNRQKGIQSIQEGTWAESSKTEPAVDDYSDAVEIEVNGDSISVSTNAIAFQDEIHGFAFQMKSRFMGTAYYNVYKTTDGGKNWLTIANEISTGGGAVEYILFNEQGHILCHFEIGTGGWSDTIISKDGGVTWEKFTQEEDHW